MTDASHIPAATLAALPPELPPADLRSASFWTSAALCTCNGFVTGPWTEFSLRELVQSGGGNGLENECKAYPMPNSSQLAFPMICAPASRSNLTTVASKGER